MDGILSVRDENQIHRCFQRLAEFRLDNRFCDISLLVEGRVIIAHKCVLAAGSKFFDGILNDMSSTKEKPVIQITHDTTFSVMSSIIQYLYTGVLEYRNSERVIFIKNLNHLGVECKTLFMKLVNSENCFQLLEMNAKELDRNELRDSILQYLFVHINELYSKDEFRELTEEQMHYVLRHSTEIDADAFSVFRAITTWIQHDEVHRVASLERFLDYIQIDELSVSQIRDQIVKDELLRRTSAGCKWLLTSIVDKSERFNFDISEESNLYVMSRGTNNFMYAIKVAEDDFDLNETRRPDLTTFTTTKFRKTIYAVGGARQNRISNVGLKYDTVRRTWTEFDCPVGKIGCGVCTKNGRMFVVGGVMDKECQRTCSTFDYETEQWIELLPMKMARWYPGITVCNSSLYVFGGTETGNHPMVVERYDPREGLWSCSGALDFDGGCVAVSLAGNIYCLKIGTHELIRYDPRTSLFTRVTGVSERSEWLAGHDDSLFLLNRFGIERYHPSSQEWRNVVDMGFQAHSSLVA